MSKWKKSTFGTRLTRTTIVCTRLARAPGTTATMFVYSTTSVSPTDARKTRIAATRSPRSVTRSYTRYYVVKYLSSRRVAVLFAHEIWRPDVVCASKTSDSRTRRCSRIPTTSRRACYRSEKRERCAARV